MKNDHGAGAKNLQFVINHDFLTFRRPCKFDRPDRSTLPVRLPGLPIPLFSIRVVDHYYNTILIFPPINIDTTECKICITPHKKFEIPDEDALVE
ncbi:hypothetical protein Trydic_g21234 [Trypoxylus dichotomus]